MKFKKHLIKIIVLGGMLAFSFRGFAQESRGFAPHDFKNSALFKELKLSETQKKQIQKIHETNHESFKANRQASKEARNKLKEAMEGSSSDQEIRQLFQESQKLQTELMTQRFEEALAIRKILNPEQRKQFQEFRKKMFEERHSKEHQDHFNQE
ncbi:MAG: Spy/CpxP family protein refolding chaperone [Deltaproteobacteria bacterium]|nr:Spy/CpxP family protein refolding chaperone [Deltaproteobacteria bacterium]